MAGKHKPDGSNMDVSTLAATAIAMKAAQTQSSMGIAMLKNQQQMDQSIVTMLDAAIQAAPPPEGMGTKVDKFA